MGKCNRIEKGKKVKWKMSFQSSQESQGSTHCLGSITRHDSDGKIHQKTIFLMSSFHLLLSRQLFIVHLPLSARCNRASLQRCQTNTLFPLKVLILPTCQRRNCDNERRNNDDDEKLCLFFGEL